MTAAVGILGISSFPCSRPLRPNHLGEGLDEPLRSSRLHLACFSPLLAYSFAPHLWDELLTFTPPGIVNLFLLSTHLVFT